MRAWRDMVRQLPLNLGLLALMWVLDRWNLLPRLYPRIVGGELMWDKVGAPTGILLVLVTLIWAYTLLGRKVETSGKAATPLRPVED